MTRFTVTRNIKAPVDLIFDTISDIHNFSKAIPHIVKAEILPGVKSGVGTRFRETRLVGGKEATTELEVTEYLENDRIRIVTDSHGTVWDSLITVKAAEGHTELKLTMDAKAHKLISKLMTRIVKGLIQKGIEKDMDAVKTYCEK